MGKKKPSSRKPKIHGCDCHESDYSFMRRVSDRLNIPWQVMASDDKYVDLIREARYTGMTVKETVEFLQDSL